MDFLKLVEQLVPILGPEAATALAEELRELISDESPAWQRSVLALVADAVEKHGIAGIQIALDQIEILLEGDEEPEIDWANLMVASDLVASLQNAEADRKSAARDFLARIGKVLGPILSGIIRGIISEE
jgi:hypothetical protein